MSADWPLVTIDSIKADSKGSIAIGPFGSRMKSDCYVEDGIPVIRGTNITGGPTFEGNFVYITQDKADSLGSSNVYQYDLVFPHRGSIGEVGIILDDERYVISSSLMKLTCDRKRVNPKFLYYFFKSSTGRHELLKNASQVGTPGIGQPLSSLKSIEFRLPPLRIQDRIEVMLTSLDTKIELNRQTNKTLEQIAQAIFKSWFVDFEPVKAKAIVKEKGGNELAQSLAAQACICGAISLEQLQNLENDYPKLEDQLHPLITKRFPDEMGLDYWSPETLHAVADLFPNTLVESELGEVPEGWRVANLKDLSVKISKGTTPSKMEIARAEDTESIPFLKVRDISNDGEITRTDLDKIPDSVHLGVLKRSILETNDLLFSIAGTIGRVALVEDDLNNSNCNQAVAFVRLSEPETHLELCRLNLISSRVQNEVISKVVQGVQANFSLAGLGEIKIVLARQNLLDVFNENIVPIAIKQRLLLKENRNLSELRDALLPKLLSGGLQINQSLKETG